ncbi:hypothetical protein [Thermomonospora umbrina]|uniref:Uncharacterized protein n=1 Tax=Thermomonospora umbrina TaxID=111806 RepID=A0A3D9T0D7_9ACTN|nr:hypothetical protein [Thermomonospora umbrina]REF00261.1 hypothetical protein DFJ69_5789 [Thermomonospora umbrina]
MSGQHYLIVHQATADGMDVEHPPTCPTTTVYGGLATVHTCHVGSLQADPGLDLFFHLEDPHPHAEHSAKVTPGRYPIEAWQDRIEYPGGLEFRGGLCLATGGAA